MNRFKLLTITALTLIASARPAAANQVTETFSMPVTMQVSAATTGCTNSPGPQITFGGQFALEGLNANLTFSNNAKGTHTHTDGTQVSAAILAAGQSVVLPKQPSSGGVGGNPFIWCQMLDGNGRAITDEIFLGRCVQGNFQTQAHFALPMRAVVDVDVANCSNNPGPIITFGGSLSLASGLKARLIFRNNNNPVGGPHKADVGSNVVIDLLQAGQVASFPKQPVQGGVGGNPWISLQLTQSDGTPAGSPTSLGRCVQSSP